MANDVHYYGENYEDAAHQFGGAWVAISRSMTDMRFDEAIERLGPPKFARALMPEDRREWLAANVPPSDYSLHVEQQRHNKLSYTRRAWIEFRNSSDAVLFKLTWVDECCGK